MKRLYAGGLVVAAALAACRPMYGAPSEKLGKPRVPVDKTLKQDATPQAPAKPELVEVCPVDINRPSEKVARNRAAAKQRLQEGEQERERAQKEADDAEKARHAKRSLQSYSEALVADPYNAEATLMLAVAYDSFRRKGCALRMLERIGLMRENPALQAEALAAADRVRTNSQWFAEYRNEALKAVVP